MYWPIGPPRIYAASSSRSGRDHSVVSDDDAASRETTEGSGSLLEPPSIGSDGRIDGSVELAPSVSTPVTPGTPFTPGIKPVEQDTTTQPITPYLEHDASLPSISPGQAGKEPLLALRVSRNGHLFAVITSTSLTIWQTKV
jgi:hypothetical protein